MNPPSMRPILALACLAPRALLASQEIVVRATPLDNQLTHSEHIKANEFQQTQTRNLSTTLNQLAPVTLSGTEHQGPLYARMRGANYDQTVVRLEGIRLNSPLDSGSANLIGLPADLLGDVQTAAGSHSVQAGSGAIGGVIDLKAFDDMGDQASLSIETGQRRHLRTTVRAKQSSERAEIQGGFVGALRGQGRTHNPIHHVNLADRQHTQQSLVKMVIEPTPLAKTKVTFLQDHQRLRLNKLGLQSDGSFYAHPHTSHNHLTTDRLGAELSQALKSRDQRWKGGLHVSGTHLKRHTKIDDQTYRGVGDAIDADAQVAYRFSRHMKLQSTLGLTQEKVHLDHQGHLKRHIPFASIIFKTKPTESLRAEIGLRGDHLKGSSRFYSKYAALTWQALEDTQWQAKIGTGFRAPSLFDRAKYADFQKANPHLKPEKSHSYTLSLIQNLWQKQAQITITGFMLDIDRLIKTRKISPTRVQRVNAGTRHVKGLEVSTLIHMSEKLNWRTACTLTKAHDTKAKTKPLRLPQHKLSSTLTLWIKPEISTFLGIEGRSRTRDVDFAPYPARHKHLAGRGIVNVGSTWTIVPQTSVFARVHNVFNKRYEDQYGYGPAKRTFILGGSVKL